MVLNPKLYDALKWIALVALPAIAAFYFPLAGIWNLPYASEIPATIMLIDTLLGLLLGISSERFKNSDARFDGAINIVQKPDGGEVHQLSFSSNPDNFAGQKDVVLRVTKDEVPLPSPPRS